MCISIYTEYGEFTPRLEKLWKDQVRSRWGINKKDIQGGLKEGDSGGLESSILAAGGLYAYRESIVNKWSDKEDVYERTYAEHFVGSLCTTVVFNIMSPEVGGICR